VQLDEIDLLDTEIGARAIVPLQEALAVVVLRQLLHPAPHLGRDQQLGMAPVQLPAELLASPVAVDVRGVEEGDPLLDGGVERLAGVVGGDRPPVGAELPGAQADNADAAAESLDSALLHPRRILPDRHRSLQIDELCTPAGGMAACDTSGLVFATAESKTGADAAESGPARGASFVTGLGNSMRPPVQVALTRPGAS